MQIAQHKLVRLHYELTSDDGQPIGTSKDGEPLVYVHGTNTLLPGVEQALEGSSAGDEVNVTLPPEAAYGPYLEDLRHTAPRDRFPADADLKPGMTATAQTPEGEIELLVVEVTDEGVTLEGNHPLAGLTLVFEVRVLEVRDPSPEELEEALSPPG